MRLRPDGSGAEIYATGLRNSVGFDWAPWDGALYATDNGRDLLGDDFPPDELNRIEQGRFYGWPYVNGFGVADPDVGGEYAGDPVPTHPVHGFRPHNAPLGIHFVRAAKLPAGYERTALVALHGSWNRRAPDGYKVVALRWRDDGTIEESDFLTGFLNGDGIIGRPAFVTEGPDGAIYVSDDYAGVVYRVSTAS
jgi:glucose/arabinose dehydrogenase